MQWHVGATFDAERDVFVAAKMARAMRRANRKTNHFKRVSNHFARIKVPLDMKNRVFVQVRCNFFCFF